MYSHVDGPVGDGCDDHAGATDGLGVHFAREDPRCAVECCAIAAVRRRTRKVRRLKLVKKKEKRVLT